MPNWCNNMLRITAKNNKKDLKKIYKAITINDVFTLEKVVPIPNTVTNYAENSIKLVTYVANQFFTKSPAKLKRFLKTEDYTSKVAIPLNINNNNIHQYTYSIQITKNKDLIISLKGDNPNYVKFYTKYQDKKDYYQIYIDENNNVVDENPNHKEKPTILEVQYWYQWNIDNWGTKWDVEGEINLSPDEIICSFQ